MREYESEVAVSMIRLLAGTSFGLLLLCGSTANASSLLSLKSQEITFINDSDSSTYVGDLGAECKVKILYDPANIYPYGKDNGKKEGGPFPLYDDDFGPKTQALVNRLRAWSTKPLQQRITTATPTKQAAFSECLKSADLYLKQELEKLRKAQAEAAECESNGKKMREIETRTTWSHKTEMLCLSDFEYASLQRMEEDRRSRESYQDEMRWRQRQEAARAERERKRRAWSNALNGISNTLKDMQRSQPVNCYSTGNAYGNTYGGTTSVNSYGRTTCY